MTASLGARSFKIVAVSQRTVVGGTQSTMDTLRHLRVAQLLGEPVHEHVGRHKVRQTTSCLFRILSS